jgi:DNA-binding response OmpR family regulator
MAKILLVDDDRFVTEIFASLQCSGHELFHGHGGKEAVNLCRSIAPDLAIIDAELPSGMSLLWYLKNRPDTKQVPIIMITPAGSNEQKARALLWGADDYLDKPLIGLLLQARVDSTLRRRELETELVEREAVSATTQRISEIKHEINNPLAGIIANVQVLRLLIKDAATEKRLAEMEDLGFRISLILETLSKPPALRKTDYVDLEEMAVAG